ncbi:MAG: hypothetical protein FJ221_09390 [Lentisphaerae bacterium]|nr:hypothetical protein [Lentisphaerota bacterium]
MIPPESTGTAGNGERPAEAAAADGPGSADAAGAAPGAASAEPAKSALSRTERRERAVADALRTLLRDLHDQQFGPVAPQSPEIGVVLRLRAKPSEGWALSFEPPLGRQVLTQIEGLHALLGVYRDGALYCFKCGSTTCDHAAPPGPLSVFAGYDPMGLPEWRDFAQTLIERRDERVGSLFERSARVVAAVQAGRDLRARQLATFGRSTTTYSILGQVTAGYFLSGPAADPSSRFALTFQAVETRGAGGAREVRLNMLGGPAGGPERLEGWLASDAGAGVARARDAARRAIALVELIVDEGTGGAGADVLHRAFSRVPAILRRLAESIERGGRQTGRRTRHVEQRRVEDRRPVPKAMDDLAAARDDAIYRDEKEDTLVVCGPQGRAHVFNLAGRHVTSFVLAPDGAAFRVRTARWSPADAAAIHALRTAIAPGNPPSGPEPGA